MVWMKLKKLRKKWIGKDRAVDLSNEVQEITDQYIKKQMKYYYKRK